MLAGTGIATIVGSVFGAYTLNLSAITAAMMAGPDAHPDRSRRWIATVTSGAFYIVFGLGASAATALVSASPPILITAIAGLALFGALVSAVTTRARAARAPAGRDHHVPGRRGGRAGRRHRLGPLGARRRRHRDALARLAAPKPDAATVEAGRRLAKNGERDGQLGGEDGEAADDAHA